MQVAFKNWKKSMNSPLEPPEALPTLVQWDPFWTSDLQKYKKSFKQLSL